VSPHATKWFSGVGVADVMGKMFLVIPFGGKACATIRAEELDSMVPIAGRAGSRFVSLIALDKKGLYQKFEFSFDTNHEKYLLWHDYVDSAELALAILPKGVCATIVIDGTLDIFVPTTGAQQKVTDSLIKTGTQLAQWNGTVVYADGGLIWKVHMK
jgi:hypothetical protein